MVNVPMMENSKDLITTEEIGYLFKYQKEIYSNDLDLQMWFSNEERKQWIEETKILSRMSIKNFEEYRDKISDMISDKISDKISSMDVKKLKNLVSNQFFNPKVMEFVICLTDMIFRDNMSQEEINKNKNYIYFPAVNPQIWVSELKQFGGDSTSGYVLKASMKGKSNSGDIGKDIFVIKIARDEISNDELIHEAFVGITSLNHLRNYIPNFTYIYGLFQCSSPIINPETKDVISWCQDNGDTNYLLMENISNAVSFKDFVATATLEDFVSLYLQTLYAIRTGYMKYNFTHYDLHSSNILIRDIPNQNNQKVAIPYQTENGLEYWIGSKIATIIDYGRVHIRHEEKNYGFWALPSYYIYPNRSYLLYDAYKLLGYLLINIKRTNPKIFEEASKILNFFNTSENKSDFIDENYKYYYVLPLTGKISEKTLDDLLIYIRSTYDCSSFISSDPQNYQVLSCQNDKFCFTQQEIVKEIGLDQEYPPKSIFELCALIKRFKRDPSLKNNYLNQIDNEKILFEANQEFNHLRNSINQKLDQLSIMKKIRLEELRLHEIFHNLDLDLHRSYIFKIAEILSDLETLQYIYESYDCVVKFYNQPKYNQYGKKIRDQGSDLFNKIIPYLNLISKDIDHIMLFKNIGSDHIKNVKNRIEKEEWLWKTFPKFKYIKRYI